jgi:hypothetical protein
MGCVSGYIAMTSFSSMPRRHCGVFDQPMCQETCLTATNLYDSLTGGASCNILYVLHGLLL